MLNDTSKAALAAVTQADILALPDVSAEAPVQVAMNLTGIEQMYRAAGIDISAMLMASSSATKIGTIGPARQAIFIKSGLNANPATFKAMGSAVVDGFYDGSYFNDTVVASKTMRDLEIGDIIATWGTGTNADSSTANLYWVGIYQGNGQFLMSQQGAHDDTKVRNRGVVVTYADDAAFAAEYNDTNWSGYFVLRPAQRYPDIAVSAPVWNVAT